MWPLSPIDEHDRLLDIDDAFAFGNHKGATKQPEQLKQLITNDINYGFAMVVPLSKIANLPHVCMAPLNVAPQHSIDEYGNVVEKDRLHPRGGRQLRMFEHLAVGYAHLIEQQPDDRGCVWGCGFQGNFSHGPYPLFLLNAKYNQPASKSGSILGLASHLAILLAVAQPAVQQRADVFRPA